MLEKIIKKYLEVLASTAGGWDGMERADFFFIIIFLLLLVIDLFMHICFLWIKVNLDSPIPTTQFLKRIGFIHECNMKSVTL